MSSAGLNIFYSDRKYTEKDCVRLNVRHYPLYYRACHMLRACCNNLLRIQLLFSFLHLYIFDLLGYVLQSFLRFQVFTCVVLLWQLADRIGRFKGYSQYVYAYMTQ